MATGRRLPFEYQMRGQQMQYLHGDLLAHAIDQRDRDLEDYLGGTSWVPITLSANVAARAGTGVPRVRLVGDVAEVEGIVNLSTGFGNPIMTIPVGYRPKVICGASGCLLLNSGGNPIPVQFTVFSDGTYHITGATGPGYVAITSRWAVS